MFRDEKGLFSINDLKLLTVGNDNFMIDVVENIVIKWFDYVSFNLPVAPEDLCRRSLNRVW